MKKTVIYIGLFISLFLVGFFIARDGSGEIKSVKQTRILLGTIVNIQVRDKDEEKAEEAVKKAFAEVKRVDDLFSVYSKSSPVRQINDNGDSILIVNDEIYNLMILSDSLWKLSQGSFDAAIESLVRTWGFNGDSPRIPAEADIKSGLKESGWDKIRLLNKNSFLRKGNVKLSFNAVAKGYAVDRAIEILRQEGIENALINAGGEIKSIGKGWVVGVQHPREMNEILERIELNGISAATSGDYENYFEENGIRYHHILNPENGYPAAGLQSVTIINKDNAFADGLATAVFVLGKIRGLELVEKLKDTEAMLIDNEGEIFYSSGFYRYHFK